MTDIVWALHCAAAAGITSIEAERWSATHAVAFWVEPKDKAQAFWEAMERRAMRRWPLPDPTYYVFTDS